MIKTDKLSKKEANKISAQINYLSLRVQGASVAVAGAYVSTHWNVPGGVLAEVELIVPRRGIDHTIETCSTQCNDEIH